VLLEGLGQLKNPMTSLGFESTAFRLVAYVFIKFGIIRMSSLKIAWQI
jgi:hypothetical protein